ncbi:MAG: 30S ribosomal protein S2 [Candidatus Liptonbacteria bacterium]|nr:30S ribosomal protein S2 [Candidatus Liptonbacteria bacterium]
MAEEIKAQYPAPAASVELDEATREMIDAGVFYGKRKNKTHPRMKGAVLANRGGIEIVNLAKTSEELVRAMNFLKEKTNSGSLYLVVGTQPAAQEIVETFSKTFKFPYVVNRWVGGTLTNFKIISQRVDYMKKLRSGLATGAFDKYTKKERLGLERELERLLELMAGLEELVRIPDVLIVIDPVGHEAAVREARQLNVPIVSLADTDADPESITYAVPGNTKAKKSVEWFLGKLQTVVAEGKSKVQAPASAGSEAPSAAAA